MDIKIFRETEDPQRPNVFTMEELWTLSPRPETNLSAYLPQPGEYVHLSSWKSSMSYGVIVQRIVRTYEDDDLTGIEIIVR